MSAVATAAPMTPPPKGASKPVAPFTPVTGLPIPYRLSVAQYQQMTAAGVFAKDERVELIDGYMVQHMSRTPPHDGTLDLLQAGLRPHLPAGWYIRVQSAVELPDSQPEPDLAFVHGTPRSFLTRHPLPGEVGLLIEVSDSTLPFDRRDKVTVYARAGIVEYWIVNLVDGRIEVYTRPSGPTTVPAFANAASYQAGQTIPLTLDGVALATIPVADLLP